jgi:hypothetical protein
VQCDYTGGGAEAMQVLISSAGTGSTRRGHERKWRQGARGGQAPPPRRGGGRYIQVAVDEIRGRSSDGGHKSQPPVFKAGQEANQGQGATAAPDGQGAAAAGAAAGGKGVGAAVAPAWIARWGFKATAA